MCGCAGLLGQHNSITSNVIIEEGVLAAMLSLICTAKHKSQLAGLQVLASLALVSNTAAQKLLSQRLLAALQVNPYDWSVVLYYTAEDTSPHTMFDRALQYSIAL